MASRIAEIEKQIAFLLAGGGRQPEEDFLTRLAKKAAPDIRIGISKRTPEEEAKERELERMETPFEEILGLPPKISQEQLRELITLEETGRASDRAKQLRKLFEQTTTAREEGLKPFPGIPPDVTLGQAQDIAGIAKITDPSFRKTTQAFTPVVINAEMNKVTGLTEGETFPFFQVNDALIRTRPSGQTRDFLTAYVSALNSQIASIERSGFFISEEEQETKNLLQQKIGEATDELRKKAKVGKSPELSAQPGIKRKEFEESMRNARSAITKGASRDAVVGRLLESFPEFEKEINGRIK